MRILNYPIVAGCLTRIMYPCNMLSSSSGRTPGFQPGNAGSIPAESIALLMTGTVSNARRVYFPMSIHGCTRSQKRVQLNF